MPSQSYEKMALERKMTSLMQRRAGPQHALEPPEDEMHMFEDGSAIGQDRGECKDELEGGNLKGRGNVGLDKKVRVK